MVQLNNYRFISQLVDYYEGGQKCDETKSNRRTEVHIQCCEGTHYQLLYNSNHHQFQTNKQNVPTAVFATIREPELCSYQAIICASFMCLTNEEQERSVSVTEIEDRKPKRTNKKEKSVTDGSNKSKEELVRFMKVINNTCLFKQEEWWTYEICFNKGARQGKEINKNILLK